MQELLLKLAVVQLQVLPWVVIYGKGYGNGDETTYVASHVGDSQSKTVINAGGDVTLAGSQVKGKRVELDAENLNIESLQDKSRYHGKTG